jgi:hypothetical protein
MYDLEELTFCPLGINPKEPKSDTRGGILGVWYGLLLKNRVEENSLPSRLSIPLVIAFEAVRSPKNNLFSSDDKSPHLVIMSFSITN